MTINTFRIAVTTSAIMAFAVIAVVCIVLGGPPELLQVAGEVLSRMMGAALRPLPPGPDGPPQLAE